MTDSILVSVVVPAYNAESTIEDCLNSIRKQSHHNLEVIVVDDGSTDNTVARITEVAKSDLRIKLLQGGHRGVSHARNVGIDAAKGSWLAFCDADDRMPSSSIESMLSMSDLAPIIAGAMSFDYLTADDVVEKSCVLSLERSQIIAKSDFDKRFDEMWSKNAVQSSCSKLFNAHLLNESYSPLRFDENLNSYEDLDFVLRFLARSESFAFVSDVCYCYLNRNGEFNHNKFKEDLNSQMERVALSVGRFYQKILDDTSSPSLCLRSRQFMAVAVNNAAKAPGGCADAIDMIRDLFKRPVFIQAIEADGPSPNLYTRLIVLFARRKAFGLVLSLAIVRNMIRSRRAY